MKHIRPLAAFLSAAALLLTITVGPARAAGASVIGQGIVATAGPGAAFEIELDDSRRFAFSYLDYATDPVRVVTIEEPLSVDCLGELFGGQTVRVTGAGADSATPDRPLTAQLYLVDGGALGADQISLKVTEADGTVVYFAPLRALESGDLVVSCGS